MGFKKQVPSTSGELKEYLKLMFENIGHVKSVKVNSSNSHLEIDLDFAANLKYSDVYMPIKKGKISTAKDLIERMMTQGRAGYPPSDADAEALFDMIDQHAG